MADETIPPHKGARNDLTQERLKEVLNYNPETGVFRWRVYANKNGAHVGDEAGWVQTHKTGVRRKIAVDKRDYMAHRLAWLYMTGEWPPFEVDHQDVDGLNNQWGNLRLATPTQNQSNRPLQKNNKSGYKGVFHMKSGRFTAYIKANGVRQHIGVYDTAEQAHEARIEAARELHGAFMRLG